MSFDQKILSLIVNLNKLTASEEIKWTATEPPKSLSKGTDDFVSLYLQCIFKEQKIAIFERRYRNYSPEFEEMYWSSQIVIAIVDYADRIIWENADSSSALYDLFETAKRKTSRIDQLLESLLSSKDSV